MPSTDHEPAVPFISTALMREVDRAMSEDYGILLIQMMENAGRELASLARTRFLAGDPRERTVLVLAGKGGNGGGGLVCARRLSGWGAAVQVLLSAPGAKFAEVPRRQIAPLERMGVPIEAPEDRLLLPPADLIVDALVGYGLTGAPRGTSAELIRAANDHDAPVLSLDVPSGVDSATGAAHDPSVRAAATMTLALPKEGLGRKPAKEHVGELYLADIGVPPGLYSRPPLNLDVGPVFAREEIVRLW